MNFKKYGYVSTNGNIVSFPDKSLFVSNYIPSNQEQYFLLIYEDGTVAKQTLDNSISVLEIPSAHISNAISKGYWKEIS